MHAQWIPAGNVTSSPCRSSRMLSTTSGPLASSSPRGSDTQQLFGAVQTPSYAPSLYQRMIDTIAIGVFVIPSCILCRPWDLGRDLVGDRSWPQGG